MIEVRNLCKGFGDRKLFDHFSLWIGDGEMMIIRGKSGCGKTTLLNMIGGIEKPDSGEIFLDGKNVHKDFRRKDYFGQRVGFVFQNYALIEGDTVRSNLELIPKRNRNGITIDKALDKVGMRGMEQKRVYQLSGGEQQRIAIARILMKKCDVVLADEPTGSLDPENAGFIVRLLKEINQEGKTVIVVTHSDVFDDVATKKLDLK